MRIAAKADPCDRLYWHDKIEPLIRRHPNVAYLGEIADHRKAELLRHAAALLFPIDWPEPFGLVMIEAMACGTPVIGWNMGAVPEIIEYGVTGFVVDDVSQAVEAVGKLATLDLGRIRTAFEQRFTATRMTRDYVALYRQLHHAGLPSRASLPTAANALELADVRTAE